GAGDGQLDRAAEQRGERGPGGAGADVGELAQGVELQGGVTGVGHGAGPGSFQAARRGAGARVSVMRASQSTSRAISPSERTAAPETGASSARSVGSGRVTSSRWPMRDETARAMLRS